MAKKRKTVPSDVEVRVLEKCKRRCCLCFSLDVDFKEKEGQIAHLDRNPANCAESNLTFLCLRHHSLYDSKTSQHKNYTIEEVKRAKSALEAEVETQKPLAWAIVLSGTVKDFNRPRVEAVAEHLRTLLNDPHLTITSVKRSSVRLDVSSAFATFERMQSKFERGDLGEIFGHSIRRLATVAELDEERLIAASPTTARITFPSYEGAALWSGPTMLMKWALVDRFAHEWTLGNLPNRADASRERTGEQMNRAIASLSVQERAILTLSVAGWTDNDIASVLNLNDELVRGRRLSAVLRLRDRLSQENR